MTEPATPAAAASSTSAAPAAATTSTSPADVEILCLFLHRYLDFRLPEIDAIAERLGHAPLTWVLPDGGLADSPFWRLRLPSWAVASELARHSLLCKVMLDVWGEGETLAQCVDAALAHPAHLRSPFLAADTSFRVVVDGFGVRYSMAEQRAVLDGLLPIPFLGRVDLRAPEQSFWIIETHGMVRAGQLPPVPKKWYFGREVGRGDRSRLPQLDLKSRRYLGPTSMDHEMALLMCTQALAGPGRLVHDPFAGTGSILVAAASRGALTMGGDIDVRVLRDGKVDKARGERVTVWTNFSDARLPPPLALLRCDLAAMPLRRALSGWAHAWICDPPYGVRAGGRKSGGRKRDEDGNAFPVADHLREGHVPSTAFYPLSECIADLLEEAARALAVGGRLVYFYPARCGVVFEPSELPAHPCLQLVAHSMQPLSMKWGRRLVTMCKAREWDSGCAAAAQALQAPMREALDAVRELVFETRGVVGAEAAEEGVRPNGEAIYRNKRC